MPQQHRNWGERALRELLGSEARARVIAWICCRPGNTAIVGAQLARELGLAPNSVWVELERLEALGMLRAGERLGRVKPYFLNEGFPLLPGLRSIVRHATGVIGLLREKLGCRTDIDVAFVYGSLATGTDGPESDVDLFVVGDIDGLALSQLVHEVEAQVQKEIEIVHWSAPDLAQHMSEPSSFLSSVMRQPKIFTKGDEDDLRRITGQ